MVCLAWLFASPLRAFADGPSPSADASSLIEAAKTHYENQDFRATLRMVEEGIRSNDFDPYDEFVLRSLAADSASILKQYDLAVKHTVWLVEELTAVAPTTPTAGPFLYQRTKALLFYASMSEEPEIACLYARRLHRDELLGQYATDLKPWKRAYNNGVDECRDKQLTFDFLLRMFDATKQLGLPKADVLDATRFIARSLRYGSHEGELTVDENHRLLEVCFRGLELAQGSDDMGGIWRDLVTPAAYAMVDIGQGREASKLMSDYIEQMRASGVDPKTLAFALSRAGTVCGSAHGPECTALYIESLRLYSGLAEPPVQKIVKLALKVGEGQLERSPFESLAVFQMALELVGTENDVPFEQVGELIVGEVKSEIAAKNSIGLVYLSQGIERLDAAMRARNDSNEKAYFIHAMAEILEEGGREIEGLTLIDRFFNTLGPNNELDALVAAKLLAYRGQFEQQQHLMERSKDTFGRAIELLTDELTLFAATNGPGEPAPTSPGWHRWFALTITLGNLESRLIFNDIFSGDLEVTQSRFRSIEAAVGPLPFKELLINWILAIRDRDMRKIRATVRSCYEQAQDFDTKSLCRKMEDGAAWLYVDSGEWGKLARLARRQSTSWSTAQGYHELVKTLRRHGRKPLFRKPWWRFLADEKEWEVYVRTLRDEVPALNELEQMAWIRRNSQWAVLKVQRSILLEDWTEAYEASVLNRGVSRFYGMIQNRRPTAGARSSPVAPAGTPKDGHSALQLSSSFSELCGALPTGFTLVDFHRVSRFYTRANQVKKARTPQYHNYFAFVYTGGECNSIHAFDLGEASKIEAGVAAFKSQMNPIAYDHAVALDASLNLFSMLMEPLLETIPQDNQLIIVPDGTLGGLPFEALVLNAAPSESALADQDAGGTNHTFMLERQPIGYLDDARDLIRLSESKGFNPAAALVVGGLNYDTQPIDAPQLALAQTGLSFRSGKCARNDFSYLSGTLKEATEVQQLLSRDGLEVVELSAEEGSETNVRNEMAQADIVHLATHGYFLSEGCRSKPVIPMSPLAGAPDAGAMTESGIVLAGANVLDRKKSTYDGLLTGDEVASMDLRSVELVVLSACETGLGKVQKGEGVLGLRRGFSQAGVQRLVMTLWPVADEPTQRLMVDFYENMFEAGLVPAQALRKARLSMLERNRAEQGDPLIWTWGPFVATGDWN